ncbi:NAD(P)-dependent oxidoreductase [Zoogloeaceae bacteirum Par-f-2]|jgi:2-hydroxy-3-oxopropionate reductase|uniref:NAD(P)-dependent oxidoreductase n=1 Tax=Pseudothauera hydrothermalis TaxID=2184083 RepID=UPI000C7A80BD|nr:NAD(P)-dependent oxidoreductase [Pseudothauera hydrothermalis]AUM01063.1 2-hydroxy-3-oxopropionate reductase [Rhodocyclaceae bacterium]AVZ80229.1 NAD(P)-dependent oxidoreductase [Zoogloeaceae bacteirum Par-f-2]
MEVGFIGLGLMGRPMALNLIKAGHTVHVWSRRRASMQPLLEAGAGDCASAAEVARRAPLTISMVADAPDVEQVTLGPDGVADGAGAGHIHVDMSTIAPAAAQKIAGALAGRGVTMLDAPVSGGEVGAIAGKLTIMVGGDAAAFDKVRPVLEAMGQSVTLIGASGAGQVAKACNQILTGVGVAAVAEALNFATQSGVDAAKVREALLGGFAYSRILENHGQRMLDRNFKPGFKAWMHQKDMRIVMEEAHRLGLALPASAAATQMFNALVGSGMGEEDSIAMLKLLERMSGGEGA